MNSSIDYLSTVRGLKQDLFRDYDPLFAPTHHKGVFVDGLREHFTMEITYAKLTEVNERSMEFSLVVAMLLMWSDIRLSWNPQSYNNISHLYMSLDQLWFPNFHPCNSSSIAYLAQDRDQVAKVFPNGAIRTSRTALITYSCAFDTRRFPFDVQTCGLCFTLDGYDPNDFAFSASLSAKPRNAHVISLDMSEWKVQISNYTSTFPYCAHDVCNTFVGFTFVLTRNPQFWVGLVITPIFMLGFLILIGLFFSGAEGLVNNAIGFGLTTMMSMMVVVGILNDSLSKIESIPCMGELPRLFVLIQISVTSIAVIAVLLTNKMGKILSIASKLEVHKSSRWWQFIGRITRDESLLRNLLFLVFSLLHIANFAWFMSHKGPSPTSPILQAPQPTMDTNATEQF